MMNCKICLYLILFMQKHDTLSSTPVKPAVTDKDRTGGDSKSAKKLETDAAAAAAEAGAVTAGQQHVATESTGAEPAAHAPAREPRALLAHEARGARGGGARGAGAGRRPAAGPPGLGSAGSSDRGSGGFRGSVLQSVCGSSMERSGMGCNALICRALAGAAWPPT